MRRAAARRGSGRARSSRRLRAGLDLAGRRRRSSSRSSSTRRIRTPPAQHRGIDIGGGAGRAGARARGRGRSRSPAPSRARAGRVTITTADGLVGHADAPRLDRRRARARPSPRASRSARSGRAATPEVASPYVHLGIRVAAEPQGYLDPLSLPAGARSVRPLPSRSPAPAPAPAPVRQRRSARRRHAAPVAAPAACRPQRRARAPSRARRRPSPSRPPPSGHRPPPIRERFRDRSAALARVRVDRLAHEPSLRPGRRASLAPRRASPSAGAPQAGRRDATPDAASRAGSAPAVAPPPTRGAGRGRRRPCERPSTRPSVRPPRRSRGSCRPCRRRPSRAAARRPRSPARAARRPRCSACSRLAGRAEGRSYHWPSWLDGAARRSSWRRPGRMRRATGTWATRRRTCRPTSSRATTGSRATTC